MKQKHTLKKSIYLTLTACLFASLYSQAQAAIWQPPKHTLGVAAAYEFKPNSEVYEGSKLILNARTLLSQESDNLLGVTDAIIHWGFDDTNLEYASISVSPWVSLNKHANPTEALLKTNWEIVELGSMRYVTDDVLELKSYFELSFLRAGRMAQYNWSRTSPFTVNMGAQASIGWSLAESQNSDYSTVSNPFSGVYFTLALAHDTNGELYSTFRFVNGFSFSNPSRGHPTAREATVRGGYRINIKSNLIFNFYGEKRSFYFNEGGLPGLYRQSGAWAAEFIYNW